MNEPIEQKKYIKLGDKLVEISGFNEAGIPVIKARGEEIVRENGRQDVCIHVPCLKITGEKK